MTLTATAPQKSDGGQGIQKLSDVLVRPAWRIPAEGKSGLWYSGNGCTWAVSRRGGPSVSLPAPSRSTTQTCSQTALMCHIISPFIHPSALRPPSKYEHARGGPSLECARNCCVVMLVATVTEAPAGLQAAASKWPNRCLCRHLRMVSQSDMTCEESEGRAAEWEPVFRRRAA